MLLISKVEKHPFGNFVLDDSEILIIGSFPCFNGVDYGHWFYCGSGKSDFWKLISETYNVSADTKEQKIDLCIKNKIAITDIAYSIERINGNCKDSNLKIIEYNKSGIEKCLAVGITKILFTSKFVETHFTKLFPSINLPTFVLISPSRSASVYIASLEDYKNMKTKNEINSTYDYRLICYKRLLRS